MSILLKDITQTQEQKIKFTNNKAEHKPKLNSYGTF